MELLSLEVEGIEGVVFPVLGWVAIVSVVVLLLGGVGLGIYIRGRYFNSNVTIWYIERNVNLTEFSSDVMYNRNLS